LLLRPEDIEICVKDYGVSVDLVVDADLGAFTRVWLGYSGLLDANRNGQIALRGSRQSVAAARRMLRLANEPVLRRFLQ
jgi:hypothetical protein